MTSKPSAFCPVVSEALPETTRPNRRSIEPMLIALGWLAGHALVASLWLWIRMPESAGRFIVIFASLTVYGAIAFTCLPLRRAYQRRNNPTTVDHPIT